MRKPNLNFAVSACPSVRKKQCGAHLKEFSLNFIFEGLFLNLSKKNSSFLDFKLFALFCVLYVFFWVIPWRLKFYMPTFREQSVCSIFIGR